jgi:hypothetical protein
MGVIFSRQLFFVSYIVLTVIACGEIFFSGSFSASGAALLGSALCCFGTASFVCSWLARREENYRPGDLATISAIAGVLNAAGTALLVWSGFRFKVFDVVIKGDCVGRHRHRCCFDWHQKRPRALAYDAVFAPRPAQL